MINLFKKKKRHVIQPGAPSEGFVDIYCILSRAMFFDLSTGEVIEGERAVKMLHRRNKATIIGQVTINDGIKVRVWRDHDTLISGNIYKW